MTGEPNSTSMPLGAQGSQEGGACSGPQPYFFVFACGTHLNLWLKQSACPGPSCDPVPPQTAPVYQRDGWHESIARGSKILQSWLLLSPPPLSHVEKPETQAWTQLQEAGRGGLLLLPGERAAISHQWQSSLTTSLPLPKGAQRASVPHEPRVTGRPQTHFPHGSLCCSLKGLWLSDSWNASAPGCVSPSLLLMECPNLALSHAGAPLLFHQVGQSPCSTFMLLHADFLCLQERG